MYSGYNYRPQRSWAKVMFLQACVCPRGGCLPQCMLGSPPGPGPPLGADTPLPDQIPPGSRLQAPPPGSRLQHMVNERPVCILLECILVTGRNEVVAKVMFLQVCVCPQGGEGVCLSACWDAIPPPMEEPPPLDREPPPPPDGGTPPWIENPPRMENPPPPPGSRL